MKLEDRKAGEREDRPTPETDALLKEVKGWFPDALQKRMKQMERERDEAREKLKELQFNLVVGGAGMTWRYRCGHLAHPKESDDCPVCKRVSNLEAQRDRLLQALKTVDGVVAAAGFAS